MKKLYSYFLVIKHDRTELLKEEFEIKDINGEEFVYFSKHKIHLLSQVPVNEFAFETYQAISGYRMLSFIDYSISEIKPIFFAQILPQREKLLKELAQKLSNTADQTRLLISNPIKVL
jgi:hypothetical protein